MVNKELRILMVLDKLNIGGTETYTLSITKELLSRGVSVVIVARKGPMSNQFRELGCPVYTQFPRSRTAIFHRLLLIIERHQINLVHTHQLPSGQLVKQLCSSLEIPLFFTAHGTYYPKRQLVRLVRNHTTTISVSPPVKDWLERMGISSYLIPNGIDTNEFAPNDTLSSVIREELGIPDQAPLLLYVSRLAIDKVQACKEFIRAGIELKREHPDLHLAIVGGGSYAKRIKTYVDVKQQAYEEPFIHMLGSQFEMPALYAGSDCVVGTGRVALEAMSCQKPVVALGSRGLYGEVHPSNYTEAWQHYFGDHRQPEKRDHSLAAELDHVLTLLPEIRQQAEEGREFVVQNFQLSRIVDMLLDLYQKESNFVLETRHISNP